MHEASSWRNERYFVTAGNFTSASAMDLYLELVSGTVGVTIILPIHNQYAPP